jgi:hypothetical protein
MMLVAQHLLLLFFFLSYWFLLHTYVSLFVDLYMCVCVLADCVYGLLGGCLFGVAFGTCSATWLCPFYCCFPLPLIGFAFLGRFPPFSLTLFLLLLCLFVS